MTSFQLYLWDTNMAELIRGARWSFMFIRIWKFHIIVGLAALLSVIYYVNVNSCGDCNRLVIERVFFDSDNHPSNSKFRVSSNTKSYTINHNPECWISSCRHKMNEKGFSFCIENEDANEWNAVGMRIMERYTQGTPSREDRKSVV